MTDATVTLSRVRYAPEVPGFAGLAHVRKAGVEHVYPVQMAAPLTAEFDTVRRALTRRGLAAHRNAQSMRLRMVRRGKAQSPAGSPRGIAA